MPKRSRTYSAKKPPRKKQKRSGYTTVARTRGPYAHGEMKYFDTARDGSIASSATWAGTEVDPNTVDTLVAPTVGAGINQRIGKAIHIHKIKIRGRIYTPTIEATANAPPTIQIRLVLCLDKQTNSSQMQGEQLFPSSAATNVAVNAFQNIDNFGRFLVLKDKTFTLQNPNMSGDNSSKDVSALGIPFKLNYRFKKPLQVRFNATNGGTIADIVDNSLHMLANASTATAPFGAALVYASRICYKE